MDRTRRTGYGGVPGGFALCAGPARRPVGRALPPGRARWSVVPVGSADGLLGGGVAALPGVGHLRLSGRRER